MKTALRNTRARTESASTAGMLLSLAHALPAPDGPLGRRARTVADQIAAGRASTELELEAADLLARLLDETDTDASAYADDALLDADFDA